MTTPTALQTPRRFAAGLVAAAVLGGVALLGAPADAAKTPRVSLTPIGTYATGQFDEAAAEIPAYDARTERLFVVNSDKAAVDVLDISDPTDPTLDTTLVAAGGAVNSIAIFDGVLAAAVEADPSQDPGTVEFYDTKTLALLNTVPVGSLPDMLTFTPDGTKVVVANEGEPDEYCPDGEGDPEGSVSVIDVSGGVSAATVATAGFGSFNGDAAALRTAGVRIFGPNASVAQDLEPEYVAIDDDSSTARVTLQENNAFAVVDLTTATVTDILPLGYKDHSLPGNGLDPSNEDDGIAIANWPVKGAYMPDAVDSYEHGNKTYLVTANEGDARDYDCYSEELRIGDEIDDEDDVDDDFILGLVPGAFPAGIQAEDQLGRLNTSTAFYSTGIVEDDGEFADVVAPASELYSYGARSFSIFDAAGELVYDSGDDFEQITATALPEEFNSTNDENDSFDNRSDDKGPEPEGVEIARVYSKTYAFIGLERVGGVMVYDITTPKNPKFVEYVNTRDFTGDAEAGTAGDLGPEGLEFIAPADSPNGMPLLAVANEVSGTTTIFEISGPGTPR